MPTTIVDAMMGLTAGPAPDVGEVKVKRGAVPKVQVHDARGVTVVPNPCKLSHCHPPPDAHGLQLSLPHHTCYVGGVSSGKSAALLMFPPESTSTFIFLRHDARVVLSVNETAAQDY